MGISTHLHSKLNSNVVFTLSIIERQQLPGVPPRTSAPHLIPADLQCAVPSRQQADAHGSQAGEHSLRGQRLRGRQCL